MSNEDNDDVHGFTQPIKIVADPPNKTIWLWKGKKSSVREKFIAAQKSQELRKKLGLDYSIVPINEGKEPLYFLRLIEEYKKGQTGKNGTDDYDLSTPYIFIPPGAGGAGQGVRKEIDQETIALIKSRKFCKHCGSKLIKEQKICKICGNKVE